MEKMAHPVRTVTYYKRKTDLLLHYAGPDVDDIYDTLPTTDHEDYKTVVEKLNQYFTLQSNVAFEVFNFRQVRQKPEESLDFFHTRLRYLAQTCEFSDPAKEIKDHIILTCTSNCLRRGALRDNLDLPNLLKTGRAIEISERQASQVEQQEFSSVNSIRDGNQQQPKNEATETQDLALTTIALVLSQAQALSQITQTKSAETAVEHTRTSESAQRKERTVNPVGNRAFCSGLRYKPTIVSM